MNISRCVCSLPRKFLRASRLWLGRSEGPEHAKDAMFHDSSSTPEQTFHATVPHNRVDRSISEIAHDSHRRLPVYGPNNAPPCRPPHPTVRYPQQLFSEGGDYDDQELNELEEFLREPREEASERFFSPTWSSLHASILCRHRRTCTPTRQDAHEQHTRNYITTNDYTHAVEC